MEEPDWARTQAFDIQAKVADADAPAWVKLSDDQSKPANEQCLRMLQALFAEQFHLKVRRETKEGPIYAFVIAKGGPRLTESRAGDLPGMLARPKGHLKIQAATIDAVAPLFAQELGRKTHVHDY